MASHPTSHELVPPSTSELDTMRQQIAELLRNQESTNLLLSRTRQELEQNQALVARLQSEGKGLDHAAFEAKIEQRQAARRRIYDACRGRVVTIMMQKNRDPNQNYPVHVSVNGDVMMIPRGRAVDVPVAYLEALDNAMVSAVVPEVDEYGNRRVVMHDYLYYPYFVVKGLEHCDPADVVLAQAA